MFKVKIIIFLQLFYIFLFLKTEYASPDLERKIYLNDSMNKYSIGLVSDYLEDKDGNLGIKDILSNNYKNKELKWIKSDKRSFSFGFTSSSYWIRFTVINKNKKDISWNLEADYPHINSIELYKYTGKDDIEVRKGGNSLPFKERDLFYRNFIFNQTQSSDAQSIYYIRFRSEGSMNISLWAWSPAFLFKKINNEQIFFGMFYGIFLLVVVFTLFAFLSTRKKAYLFFFIWILAYALYQLSIDGLSFQYFWPDSADWIKYSIRFFILLALICGLQYGRSFLNIKENLPGEDKFLISLILLSILGIFFLFTVSFPFIIVIVFAIIIYIVRLILITKSRSRYNPLLATKYYIIAWITLIAGVSVFILKSVGLFSGNIISNWSQHVGFILHVIFLGLALADNANRLNKEKQYANIRLIETLKTAGQQKDEFLKQTSKKNIEIEKLNAELERHIQDLNEANKKISVSEEKYRILVEGSNDIIFSLDERFRFKTVNSAIKTHLNIKPLEIISAHFMDIIHEGGESVSVSKQLVLEKLEVFAADKKPISFKTEFKTSITSEPKEMRVHLEYVNMEGRNEIIGKATRVEDDALIKYIEFENQRLTIGNYFVTAEDISHRLTRNLVKYMDYKKAHLLRIALREILINAIEHGNLNISFEEKSRVMEGDDYFKFVSERQHDTKYNDRRVRIEYSIDGQKAIYKIKDDGDGFDYEKILNGEVLNANQNMLGHGRGITMAKNYFDELKYNDKGNEVVLIKKLN